MAKIIVKRNTDGSKSFGAQVRIKGFDAVYKSFPTRAECTAWRDKLTDELRKQRKQGNVRPDLPGLTVAALNQAYLSDPTTITDHAPRYVDQLKRSLAWWSLHYGSVRVMALGPLQLREARDRLLAGTVRQGKKRAPATVTRRLAAQRSAWRWGQATGLVPRDLSWPTRLMPREPRERVRFLSDVELKNLLAVSVDKPVLHAAVVVSLATGVRAGELLRLTWANIDFERQRLTVLVSKNGEAKSVHLTPTAIAALRALKALPVVSAVHVFTGTDGTALTYSMLSQQWRALRKSAGLRDFRWHDLRHSCASYLAQNGASLIQIASVLGHRSLQATRRYAHLVQGAPIPAHTQLDAKLRGKP